MQVACRSRLPRVVVPHRGPRVRVRGGFLDITQRHSCVECGGDEGPTAAYKA
jgi:hypothetical protein